MIEGVRTLSVHSVDQVLCSSIRHTWREEEGVANLENDKHKLQAMSRRLSVLTSSRPI
jgi:hypothetical protein